MPQDSRYPPFHWIEWAEQRTEDEPVQVYYVGYWTFTLGTKMHKAPCVVTEKDISEDPTVMKRVKANGRIAAEDIVDSLLARNGYE